MVAMRGKAGIDAQLYFRCGGQFAQMYSLGRGNASGNKVRQG